MSGMVVQHNMNALNSYNRLNFNVANMKEASEKLASGLRINRAGDDAAGLAISEKMRSQIRGLNQAKRNSQDGISMIQTYEGALTETHSILQRMKELAAESANGTYDDKTDRAAIQLEFNQLCDEMNQISDTDFNGVIALNGGKMSDSTEHTDHVFDYTASANPTLATSDDVSVSNAFQSAAADLTYCETITLQVGARSKDAVNFTFAYTSTGMGDLKANMDVSASGLGIGPQVEIEYDRNGVPIGTRVVSPGLDLSSQETANFAIDRIDYAINKVSMVRATFGSIQNRLEHKIENLTTTSENMTEAESTIRDTDMAATMMDYTKNNILQQASQSMLAQANQQPQSILQLLG